MAFCWLKQRQSQFVCLTVGSLAEALHHQLSKGAADPCRIGDHDTSVGHRIASLGLTEGLTHLFFDSGDILYSKLRPYLLKILVAPDCGICTPEIVPFKMLGKLDPEYIVAFLKCPYVDGVINSVTYGVKMPRVGTETMTELLVPIPPLSEQRRIVG